MCRMDTELVRMTGMGKRGIRSKYPRFEATLARRLQKKWYEGQKT